MNEKRQIEIFSAGCPVCNDTVEQIENIACGCCEINVLDMNDTEIAKRASTLGIRSIPAVVIDGVLVDCCCQRGVDMDTLRAAGLGQSKD